MKFLNDMNIEFHQGSTRNVILIYDIAIKYPRFIQYNLFLHGLLANLNETLFSKFHIKCCPIYFSFPLGFLNIMHRAIPLSRIEFEELDYNNFVQVNDYKIPVENKLDSFGWYKNKIVAIDYGT